MEQDKLRDFLKFIRFQLNWLIVVGGFLLVMLIVGALYLSRMSTSPTPTAVPNAEQKLELETPPITPVIVAEPNPTPRVVASDQYTVKQGDSLWSIALEKYGSGYYFSQISRENHLENPGLIEVGQQLILPEISIAQGRITSGVSIDLENQQSQLESTQPVTTYQIKPGDCLWTIAERELGDGYRWTEIYQLNLATIGENPNLIYPETELQLPTVVQATGRLPSETLLQ